jgi:type II secretory pathway pseudopilin PulG
MKACPRAQGFVLLTVLVVIMLSSMIAVSLLYSLRADVAAQTAGIEQEQGWAVAMSGIARAIAVAQQPGEDGMPMWHDNPADLQNQFVVKDGDDQWYFTVYSASESLGAELRFGLTDESGKFSVYHTDPNWLAKLPHLNAQLVQALLQGVPATNSLGGADSYGGVDGALDTGPPVTGQSGAGPSDSGTPDAAPLNDDATPAESLGAPGESTNSSAPSTSSTWTTSSTTGDEALSLDQLFANAGLSPLLLYGEDVNFNLRLDPNEDDGDASWPPDDANGQLDLGLQQYLTLVSYDPNTDSSGHPRVNINDPKADLSQCGLPQATLRYIAALRQAGRQLASVADLFDAEGDFTNSAGRKVHLRSGINTGNLATLLDHCTTTNESRLEGLINIDTAPAAVLAAIPVLGQSLADNVVLERMGLNAEESRTPAWLCQRGLLNAGQFKKLAPFITTRSWQFSLHCVAYAVPSGRYRVVSAVVDVATHPPRILALRDLTRFGFPVPLGVLQGNGSETTASASSAGEAGF